MARVNFDSILDRRDVDPQVADLAHAIYGQESSSGRADTSKPNSSNARGPMQVTEATFDGLKKKGLIPSSYKWDNPNHNAEAGVALIEDLWDQYQDPRKVAAVYFGGPGAVAGNGSIRKYRTDSEGKSVGSYVTDIMGRLSGVSPAYADEAPHGTAARGGTDLDSEIAAALRALPPRGQDELADAYRDRLEPKTYKVKWTDGKEYNVKLPPGTPSDMAAYYVQKQFYSQKPEEAPAAPAEGGPSVARTALHVGERAVAPSLAGMAAAPVGEAIGLLGGPFAPITVPLGGLITGGVAAWFAAKKQDEFLKDHPELAHTLGQDEAARAADVAANPLTAKYGDIAAGLITGKPSKGLFTLSKDALKQAAVHAGVGAGMDVGQQVALEGKDLSDVDAGEALSAAAGFALFSDPNRFGRAALRVGRMPVNMARTALGKAPLPPITGGRPPPEGARVPEETETAEPRTQPTTAETGTTPATPSALRGIGRNLVDEGLPAPPKPGETPSETAATPPPAAPRGATEAPPSPPDFNASPPDEEMTELPELGPELPFSKSKKKYPENKPEDVLAAVRSAFGIHTKRMVDSGFLNVVGSHEELPEHLRPYADEDTAGMYDPKDNKIHLIANAVDPNNIKGIILHEVTHGGMEEFVGSDEFQNIMERVQKGIKNGEKPFVEAAESVPEGTSPDRVGHEQLAYLIENRPELPLVQRLISQLRVWLRQKFGAPIELNADDLRTLAVSALKKMSKEIVPEGATQNDAPYLSRKFDTQKEAREEATRIAKETGKSVSVKKESDGRWSIPSAEPEPQVDLPPPPKNLYPEATDLRRNNAVILGGKNATYRGPARPIDLIGDYINSLGVGKTFSIKDVTNKFGGNPAFEGMNRRIDPSSNLSPTGYQRMLDQYVYGGYLIRIGNEGYAIQEPVYKPFASQRVRAPNEPEPVIDKLKRQDAEAEQRKIDRGSVFKRMLNWGKKFADAPLETFAENYQDRLRRLKTLQDGMEMSGELVEGHNDAYNAATLKPGGWLVHEVNPYVKALHDAVAEYASKAGRTVAEALGDFNGWAHGITEPLLRKYLHSMYVPLSERPHRVEGTDEFVSPADERDAIVKEVRSNKNLTSPDAKTKYGYDIHDLRKRLEYLVENFKDANGRIPEDAPEFVKMARALDVNNEAYSFTGKSGDEIQQYRNDLAEKRREFGPEIDKVFAAEKALRKQVENIERLNGHWGQHTDNAVAFQNRGDTYFTLKGRRMYDLSGHDPAGGGRLGRGLSQIHKQQDGRVTESDNPITQTIADANVALNRLDQKDMLDRLYNLIQDGDLKQSGRKIGKILDPIEIGDRNKELPEDINPDSVIFRPRSDGKIDVMQITDKDWQKALKGVIESQNAVFKGLGYLTRGTTSMMTRFNLPFGPSNAIRHLDTNVGNITARYGLGAGLSVLKRATAQLALGSPIKAARIAYYMNKGDTAKLNELAAGDSFSKNLIDYLKKGGKITFDMASSNASATQRLARELSTSPIVKTGRAIRDIADLWSNTFEFMNREAAFDTIKKIDLKRGLSEDRAIEHAAAYTKNLLNLELAGLHSKDMSAAFALWKAEATGAVRQTDAILAPLLMDAETYIRKTYGTEYQKNNKTSSEYIITNKAQREKIISNWNERRKNATIAAMASLGLGYALHKMAKAVAGNDDNGENRVSSDDHAQWVRNLRIPTDILGDFKDVLGEHNKFINIPWGFGTGALASIGAQLSALEDGDIKLSEAATHMASAAHQSFIPMPVESFELFNKHPLGWAVASAAPSVIRPLLEFTWNADDNGRQIYNTRGSKYGDAYSGGDYTPEGYKRAAIAISQATNGAWSPSPNSLQFLVNNYVQGVANTTNAVMGNYLWATGQQDYDVKRNIPMFSNLIGSESDAAARRYSDVDNDLKNLSQRATSLKNSDRDGYDRFMDNHPDATSIIDKYNRRKARLNQINMRLNKLRGTYETPKQLLEDERDFKLQRDIIMKDMTDDYDEYKKYDR
jgi:hypothetical protein